MVDAADLLSAPDEKALAARAEATEIETKHQFVIVTLPSLGEHRIEEYGRELGNHWKIGRAGVNDGVLLIVAPIERKVRIEVGDGLMKSLTNDEAAEILRTKILPRFAQDEMPAGIRAGAEAIIHEISEQNTR